MGKKSNLNLIFKYKNTLVVWNINKITKTVWNVFSLWEYNICIGKWTEGNFPDGVSYITLTGKITEKNTNRNE